MKNIIFGGMSETIGSMFCFVLCEFSCTSFLINCCEDGHWKMMKFGDIKFPEVWL